MQQKTARDIHTAPYLEANMFSREAIGNTGIPCFDGEVALASVKEGGWHDRYLMRPEIYFGALNEVHAILECEGCSGEEECNAIVAHPT